MAVGLAVALTLGTAVTLGVGDGSDVDGGADEASPLVHAVNARARASTRSVGLRDAMMTSGSARDLDSGECASCPDGRRGSRVCRPCKEAPAGWAGTPTYR